MPVWFALVVEAEVGSVHPRRRGGACAGLVCSGCRGGATCKRSPSDKRSGTSAVSLWLRVCPLWEQTHRLHCPVVLSVVVSAPADGSLLGSRVL